MNRRFVSLSRGLELVVGVVVVGQTLVTQHRLGVVPDHGPAREHAAGLPGRQRGHVEHEPGHQEIEHRYRPSTARHLAPSSSWVFLTWLLSEWWVPGYTAFTTTSPRPASSSSVCSNLGQQPTTLKPSSGQALTPTPTWCER